MQRLLQRADRWLSQMSKAAFIPLTLLLVALLGWLDYATGFEIAFSFFYLIPISMAAWYLTLKYAQVLTVTSLLLWMVSNWLAGESYSSEWIRFFNTAIRLVTFLMFAYLLSSLKAAFRSEQHTARTDYLTGTSNKRQFVEQLELELQRANRLHYPVSMVYIDLDNFKLVNDNLGHEAGDRQLTLIAHTIAGLVRKTDLFARLGGDEFGLFLPNTDPASTRKVVKKIERTVQRELRAVNSPITLSMGAATFYNAPQDAGALIHAADALMYRAKHAGKKRTLYHTFNDPKNRLK